ncbi:MAG: RNA-binding protein [Pseudomonadota bacterium]|nr:RNA-binding protein [Pseudomonadota bacterium]
MEAAHPSPPSEKTARSHNSERKCLVTGEVRSKEELIRFVVGPDNSVIPDLAQNLPGRGLWVTASRATIHIAAHKNLFSRAAKSTVRCSPELADDVARLLRKRCLEFIGMARRSGIAVLGLPQVEAAIKGHKLALLLVAPDATQQLDSRHTIPEYRCMSRNELGAALGHDQIVYVGFKDHPLTEKLAAELARLEKCAEPKTPQTDSDKQ